MLMIFPLFERNTEFTLVVLSALVFGGLFIFELVKKEKK